MARIRDVRFGIHDERWVMNGPQLILEVDVFNRGSSIITVDRETSLEIIRKRLLYDVSKFKGMNCLVKMEGQWCKFYKMVSW